MKFLMADVVPELLLGALCAVDDMGDNDFFIGRPVPRCLPLSSIPIPFKKRSSFSVERAGSMLDSGISVNVVVTTGFVSCLLLSTVSLIVDGAGDVFVSSVSVIEAISSCDFIGIVVVEAFDVAAAESVDDLFGAELVLTFCSAKTSDPNFGVDCLGLLAGSDTDASLLLLSDGVDALDDIFSLHSDWSLSIFAFSSSNFVKILSV